MGEIVITGLASNDPVPGSYIDVLFAQGDAAGSSGPRKAVILANMLSTGSATAGALYGPDTAVQLQNETDCITLFGTGSEVHRLFRRFTKVNKVTPLYVVPIADPGGTAATITSVVANAATANGVARVFCGDEFVDTTITSGDAAGTIATNVVAKINSMTHWPITAAVQSTVNVVITARQTGPRGNQIRIMTQVIGTGIATTMTQGADTFLGSGATADSNTTALATILPYRFYRIISGATDATQLGALMTQVNSQATPTTGIRQVVFAGSNDTLAAATTIATGLNAARCSLTWHKYAPMTGSEIAANEAAIEALFEDSGTRPRCNFAGFGRDAATQPYWVVKASRDATAAPTRANVVSALNNGISPIGVDANGTTYLINRVTTRSLNGATADYRIRDRHKVSISDFYGDDADARNVLNFSGKTLANDPPDGAPIPDGDIVTPSIYRGSINALTRSYYDNGLVQNVETVIADTEVSRSLSPTSRLTARVPLQPIDCLFQIGVVVAQVA